MNKDLVEIAVILDSSGSMGAIRSDAIGGFNAFVEEQRKLPGEVNFLLTTFATVPSIGKRKSIGEAELLSEDNYIPYGMTALHDAICLTIDKIGSELFEMPEEDRPHKVIVAILTDGMENASVEYKLEDVKSRINRQANIFEWEFLFLAANQDAIQEGTRMGVREEHTMSFSMTGQSVRQVTHEMSQAVTRMRVES